MRIRRRAPVGGPPASELIRRRARSALTRVIDAGAATDARLAHAVRAHTGIEVLSA